LCQTQNKQFARGVADTFSQWLGYPIDIIAYFKYGIGLYIACY